MGGAANCILVALLLLLASGYCIVHKACYKRLRIVAYTTVGVYGTIQLICAFTSTLVGQILSLLPNQNGFFIFLFVICQTGVCCACVC